jgi:hypothetical protein
MSKVIKIGSSIIYKKAIMFKGTEKTTAKVIAIKGKYALLDNGDEILILKKYI